MPKITTGSSSAPSHRCGAVSQMSSVPSGIATTLDSTRL
jgi:hypothetical protein